MSITVEIKGEDGHATIQVERYERLYTSNVDDANWLTGSVAIRAQEFSCQIDLSLRTDELARFQADLHDCLKRLDGSATFSTLEQTLALKLEFGRRGGVSITGSARSMRKTKTSMSFSFQSDQSALSETDGQLQHFIAQFPIRGDEMLSDVRSPIKIDQPPHRRGEMGRKGE
jgi:hypothetical protein